MTEIPEDVKAGAETLLMTLATIDRLDTPFPHKAKKAAIAYALMEARDKALNEAADLAYAILLADSQPVMASTVFTAILDLKEPKP